MDRLRDEEASSIWTGLMRGRPYVLVLPMAITRVRSSTITPYLPIRVLFVLLRPWLPELQGSLRDLEACSCHCCWLLAALAGTEWWAHAQLSCSLKTCCRGSQVVSFVVNQLPVLRRFSEVTEVPIARAETSYIARSMTMAAPVGVSSHIPRTTAFAIILDLLLFKHVEYLFTNIREFATFMCGCSSAHSQCDWQAMIKLMHLRICACCPLGYRYTSYRLSDLLMRCCLMLALQMAGHGLGLQRRTMH